MKYKLYAMKPTEENLARAAKGYYRATPGYLLVYTPRTPEKSVPVNVGQLSPADSAWLQKCNCQIILETAAKNKNIQKNMRRLLVNLKKELADEEQKLKGAENA